MDSARLFLALPLDDAVIDALEQVSQRLMRVVPKARWCGRDALHLTLRFFGTLPLGQVAGIDTAVCTATAGWQPSDYAVRGVGGFPRLESPRVLWAGVGDGAARIIELAEALNIALADAGFGLEERAFVPHITLARFTRWPRLGLEALEDALPGLATHEFGVTASETLVLYASELTPRGPIYTRVAHWTLGDAA
jgi:2'-5' RNA ligase